MLDKEEKLMTTTDRTERAAAARAASPIIEVMECHAGDSRCICQDGLEGVRDLQESCVTVKVTQ